jgi:hypothetical protein
MGEFIVKTTRNFLCVNSIALPELSNGVNPKWRNWAACIETCFSLQYVLHMAGITLFLVSKIEFGRDFLVIRPHGANVWHSNFNRRRYGRNGSRRFSEAGPL